MATSTQIELQEILTSDLYERLQNEANRHQVALSDIVRDAIATYLDNEDEAFEDTPDEKILADLRQGWHEAMTGQTIPADIALQRLREKLSNEQN